MPEVPIPFATAARRRLRSYPAFTQMVVDNQIGTDAEDDATPEEKVEQAWLFQSTSDDLRPYRDPEGSGRAAIVIHHRREWSAPNRHNTASFPLLQIFVYCDSTRDSEGGVVALDAANKCLSIMRLLDPCFHLPGQRQQDLWWSTLSVHSSLRGAPLSVQSVPSTQDAVVRGELLYNTITD